MLFGNLLAERSYAIWPIAVFYPRLKQGMMPDQVAFQPLMSRVRRNRRNLFR